MAGTTLNWSKPITSFTPDKIKTSGGAEVAVPQTMSLDEFTAFPWPERQRWELIWGTPVMTPSPQPPHQDLIGDLYILLRKELEEHPGHRVYSGIDVLLSAGVSYLCPDISVFEEGPRSNFIRGPVRDIPKLVVEGLSPSTRGNDQGSKLQAYASAGVPEYWTVDPSTAGLSIFVNPKDITYEEVTADEDGYLRSPTLQLAIRVRRTGTRFRVETKPA